MFFSPKKEGKDTNEGQSRGGKWVLMYRKEVVKRDQSKGQHVCAGEGRQSGG